MNLNLGDQVLVIKGPFSSYNGIVKEVKGDKVTVEVEVFGRKIPVELGITQLFPSLNRREWLHDRLQREIEREAERIIDEALTDFWREQMQSPLGTLSEQWQAYEQLKAELEMTHFAMRDERLQAMDRTISKLPNDLHYPDVLHHVADERAQWTPYLTALGQRFEQAKASAKAGDESAMDQLAQMNVSKRQAWQHARQAEIAT